MHDLESGVRGGVKEGGRGVGRGGGRRWEGVGGEVGGEGEGREVGGEGVGRGGGWRWVGEGGGRGWEWGGEGEGEGVGREWGGGREWEGRYKGRAVCRCAVVHSAYTCMYVCSVSVCACLLPWGVLSLYLMDWSAASAGLSSCSLPSGGGLVINKGTRSIS